MPFVWNARLVVYECDFVVREGNRIVLAIQVTMGLSDLEVRNQEIEGLMEAIKMYQLQEGTILTENEHETIEIDGLRILVIPIWKWLLAQ
jgi:hypothetical protein